MRVSKAVSVQAELEGAQARQKQDPEALTTINTLTALPGFSKLTQQHQARWLRLVGGTTAFLAAPARNAVNALIKNPDFIRFTGEQQAGALTYLLVQQEWLPKTVESTQDTFAMKREIYALVGPKPVKNVAFGSGKANALKYTLEVGTHAISVFVGDKNDLRPHLIRVEAIAKAIAALPKALRETINVVRIDPKRNPDDAARAADPAFKDLALSSVMSALNGTINVFPTEVATSQTSADGTFVHEVGHFLTNVAWGQNDDPRWDPWRAAIKSDGVRASKYAKVLVSEDASETLQLYFEVIDTATESEVRAIFPARFAILDTLLGKRKR